MKQILSILLLLCCTLAKAQYNNEWIDYGKTYYKFKVAKDGLHRIPQSSLQTIGLGNIPVEQFQLWRNGTQVPVHTSVASGALDGNGYIEFWGEMNDGKPDKNLYYNINFQLCDKWSLETDTASYFLTVNPEGNNLRFATAANNVNGSPLSPDPYFMHTEGQYFKNKINAGYAGIVGEYVYSSVYDKGEGYSSDDIYPGGGLSQTINNLYPYAGGPDGIFYIAASGNANNNRTLRVKVNNTQLVDATMDSFNDQKQQVSLPAALLSSGTAKVDMINTSANPNDRMVVAKFELTYARQFNFGGASNFVFNLVANTNGNLLRISNFNAGTAVPVLYDLTNFTRYEGNTAEAGVIRFALLPSAQQRKLVLVSEHSSNITNISNFVTRNFVNYALANNQGDYIIVSNPLLYSGPNGNPVEAYRQYRASGTGGGYNAKIYDIDQLTDQFAFGIKRHPFAVKNFIKYAVDVFQADPRAVLLIGKGVSYNQARQNESNSLLEKLNLVPPFGYPASDNLLASRDNQTIAEIPVGRISAVTPNEVEIYLDKVKEFESIGKNASQTIEERGWMKNIVHAIGGGDPELSAQIGGYMNQLRNIIQDTLYGGHVKSFSKTSAVASQLTNEQLQQMFAEGIGILNYFGHSSSTSIEFNIEDPNVYSNQGKYPLFLVNGCLAGDIFNFDVNRFNSLNSLSERYIFANHKGGIAFVASTHFGIVNYLNTYLRGLYKAVSNQKYGHSVGETLEESFRYLQSQWVGDYFARLHAEEITLHGDPAVSLYTSPLPDYIVEDQYITLPQLISVTDNNFKLTARLFNVGKGISDSIMVDIKRQLPSGDIVTIMHSKIKGIRYSDSVSFILPVNPAIDKGENKLFVTIDSENDVEEVSESNNSVTKLFYILEDAALPIYPNNFSIIKEQEQKLYASTANPLKELSSYIMEIDTTEVFNSSNKVSKTLSSKGGLLEFDPQFSYKDSTVYYWRVSLVPENGAAYQWSNHSFMYKLNTEGYNQSHFFQHEKSGTERMYLDSASRKWKYTYRDNTIFIRNCIYQPGCQNATDFLVSLNGDDKIMSACLGNSLMFNVLDEVSFNPWKNVDENGNNLNRYGSASANCGPGRQYNFEFSYMTASSRKLMMDFMDIIPNGAFVIVRSFDYNDPNSYSTTWKGDTTAYGSGNSLYHKLKEAGFDIIDSVNAAKAWFFIYQKGRKEMFTPQYRVGRSFAERVQLDLTAKTPDSVGYISSPVFGPAKEWKQVVWNGHSEETASADNPTIDIIGTNRGNTSETVLYTLDKNTKQFDISSVNVADYPFIKLRMRNPDSIRLTPYQLDYWRVLYKPVPEGAIAPNVFYEGKDTIDAGEKLKFGVIFKNVSRESFDSVKIKLTILDRNNFQHILDSTRRKALISGDTIKVEFTIDSTQNFSGLNTLVMNFNPDNDQPEYYLLNNFLYKSIYVKPDTFNPLMDVTFDGVHILNNDIVSGKPHILIKLKDDSKFLALDDTSLIKIQVRHPDNSLRTYSFNNDTVRFTASSSNSGAINDNTASVDFNPEFLEDGTYELIVSGRDRSGNKSGQTEYKVSFKIINKPMISNMFNYPNPFTTSTAFVFTLTGSEVPQNLRIQIMTITGKIVKEITKEELGSIRIGRNITEYKWDGTDQYGQKLANGVYLYRVITNLNGKSLERYKTEGDNTDQFFNKGYGKMYLMR